MPEKVIVIDGVIGWDVYASGVRKQLAEINGEPVTIELASPGGFVEDGIEIFNVIRNYSRYTANITIKLMGLAASMASYIAMAGDKVRAEDNAIFMIHNVWGIVIGDYREMRKFSSEIESLTDLLANEYVRKSGKSKKEIRQLMDDETYYYGDEMLDAGFVDEIIRTEKKEENKAGAVTIARTRVRKVFQDMKKSKKHENDLEKAAALITSMKNDFSHQEKQENQSQTEKQPIQNSDKEEEKAMPKLSEFLAQNPDAKAEYDSDINKARTEGVEEGRKEIQARVDKVLPFLANENYPGISPLAKKVLSGESTVDSLEGAIAAFDMMTARKKTDEAVDDSEKTPDINSGGNIPLSTDGVIRNEADAKAFADRTKGKGVA